MKLFISIIFLVFFSCTKPTEPLSNENIIFSSYVNTIGQANDVGITDTKMIVAANYQGYIVYDVNRDDQGNIITVDSIYNAFEMASDMGDNRAQKITVSQNHDIAFITDNYDKIWLYKLGDGDTQYTDNWLSDCIGGTWLSTAIDDGVDDIKVFSLVYHSSSEDDEGGTVGNFDQYSTSIVWKNISDISSTDTEPELNSSLVCEFTYNFNSLPKDIHFDNGLLAVSYGELGVRVLKQTETTVCLDDDNMMLDDGFCLILDIQDNTVTDTLLTQELCFGPGPSMYETLVWIDGFEETEDIDSDRTKCETSFLGLDGRYEPAGGFYPYIYAEHDFPGEVDAVLIRDSIIFSGLTRSNGCYMSLLGTNGVINDKLSFAQGYSINNLSEDNNILALSAGHDGVLVYKRYGISLNFIGQISTPYSNNVKVDGNNVIISTEDGLYIYLIK